MREEGTTAQAAVASGWYDDPTVAGQRRYWDGADWTQHVAEGAVLDLRNDRPTSAPPLRRIVARLIDRSVLAAGGPIVTALLIISGETVDAFGFGVFFAFTIFGWTAIDTAFVGRLGATPGKLFVGLAVVDAQTDQAPTFWQAFRRAVLGIPTNTMGFTLVGWGLAGTISGALWLIVGTASLIMLFVGDSRTVHDRLGGTRVIERRVFADA